MSPRARPLDEVTNGAQNRVVLGYNDITHVDHAGPLVIARESAPRLLSGGWFLFSFCNKFCDPQPALELARPSLWQCLVTRRVRTSELAELEARCARLAQGEVLGSGYRSLNHHGMSFGMLIYDATRACQARMGAEHGLVPVAAHD